MTVCGIWVPVSVSGNTEKSDNLPDNADISAQFAEHYGNSARLGAIAGQFSGDKERRGLFESYSSELSLDR